MEMDAQQVVVNLETPLDSQTLRARWPGLNWHFVNESPSDLRQFCESADVGITFTDAAWGGRLAV